MKFAELAVTNAKINCFPYKADAARYFTPEFWEQIDAEGGDCDDYAVGKLRMLLGHGWTVDRLRFATCYVEPIQVRDETTSEIRDATMDERYHAVLLVDLDGQTWCLDNRHPHPTEYQLLPYIWHKLQIAGTRQWEYA